MENIDDKLFLKMLQDEVKETQFCGRSNRKIPIFGIKAKLKKLYH